MKKFLSAAFAALFALGLTVPTIQAQQAIGAESFGFAFATDYSKWTAVSSGDVAAGAVVITMRDPNMGQQVTPNGRSFRPFATNAPVLIDAGGTNPETLTPSAITCASGGLTCSISVTTIYAHTGNFTIQSGTYGIAEAYNACLNSPGLKGTVVVANGFGGTTTTITTTFPAGSSSVNILDVRNGAFQFYTSSGSTYAASLSPFNTSTAAGATVTTATGAAFFYTGAFSQATNHGLANVANAANTSGATIDLLKTRTTNADGRSTTVIVTGDKLGVINAFGADGTDYINSAGIEFVSVGTVGATRIPSAIKFYTGTDAAPTVKTLALTLTQAQAATFAGAITTTNVTDSGLTITRVPFSSTGGLLIDDSDFTFATDTATITKIIGSTSISTPSLFNTAGALALSTVTSGNITLAPAAAATAATTTNARFETAAGATVVSGSCSSGDCTLGGDGNLFLVSGTTSVDGFATAGWQTGSLIVVHTDGNITFNNAGTVAGGFAALSLVGAANVSMTANDYMMLIYDGSTWNQIAPTLVK